VIRQAYKEYWDGYAPHARRIAARWAEAGSAWPLADALEALEVAREELLHYEAFAGLYDRWLRRAGEPMLEPVKLNDVGNWPENEALRRLRASHREEHGAVGLRAQWFTEGGYATLYREGAALAGRGGIDDAIATLCGPVYDDELDHMLAGIAGLADADLAPDEWDDLIAMTTAQCRLRITMRDAQFGHPLPPGRLEDLVSGKDDPLPFDWARVA
jgi:hypothetical protein